MKQPKLIGQAIENNVLEKQSSKKEPTSKKGPTFAERLAEAKRPKKGFGDQNSKIVNQEVFDNEDAIMDALDRLFGSLNFKNEKDIQAYLDKHKKK